MCEWAIYLLHLYECTHLAVAISRVLSWVVMVTTWQFFSAPSQLHVWIAKCTPTWCSGIEIQPCDTITVILTTEVQPVEVWVPTIAVPPSSLAVRRSSTINATMVVIVSIKRSELHAIIAVTSCHAVPCCPYPPVLVPSNSESVVGAWSAHMKVVITGKLGMACKVIKVDS